MIAKTQERDWMTGRLAETVGCLAAESTCGYRALADYGYTAFVAWDSADGRHWQVEIALAEGDDVSMPAGVRKVLEVEAEAGHRGSLEKKLVEAFASL